MEENKKAKWARQGSNLRPSGYEPPALPLSYEPYSLGPAVQNSQISLSVRTYNQSVMSRPLYH